MLKLIDLPYEPLEMYRSVDFLENIVLNGRTRRLPGRGSNDYSIFFEAVEQSRKCYDALHQIRDDLDLKNLETLDGVMREINFKRGIDKAVIRCQDVNIIEETWIVMQEPEQYDAQPDDDYRPVFDAVLKVLRSYQNAAQFYLDMKTEPASSEEQVTAKIRLTPPRPLPSVARRG